jgi:hypothetical protein
MLLRKYELNNFSEFLSMIKQDYEYMADTINKSKVVVTGDLNLHNLGEGSFLYDIGFRDVWLDCNDLEPGYTWDSKTNHLI